MAADFQPWFKKVDRLIVLASGFGDEVAESALKEQMENIGEVYKTLTGELAPEMIKGRRWRLRGRHAC